MDNDEVQRLFGERIRDCRKRKGISQEDLAELIGKTPDTVSNIERGFTSTRIKTAVKLAHVLDIPLTELFDLEVIAPDDRERQRIIQHAVNILKSCEGAALNGAVEVLEVFLKATSSPSPD